MRFLDGDSRSAQQAGQVALQSRLFALIAAYGACSNCLPTGAAAAAGGAGAAYVDLPLTNLLFDGGHLWQAELTEYLQGVGTLCFD